MLTLPKPQVEQVHIYAVRVCVERRMDELDILNYLCVQFYGERNSINKNIIINISFGKQHVIQPQCFFVVINQKKNRKLCKKKQMRSERTLNHLLSACHVTESLRLSHNMRAPPKM